MKFIILFLFFIYASLSVFAQVDSIYVKYDLLQTTPDKSIAVYIGKFNYRDADSAEWATGHSLYEVIMTFNNNKDTVVLVDHAYITKTLDSLSLQVIKTGHNRQAIYITMLLKEESNLGEHGYYEEHKTIHEIRDVTSGKPLFSAISNYEYTGSYDDWDDTATYSSSTDFSYRYDFVLSHKNEIIISNQETNLQISGDNVRINIATSFPSYCDCLLPDHKEGIYV